MRKILILNLIIFIIIIYSGCSQVTEKLNNKDYTRYNIDPKQEQIDNTLQNVRYYANSATMTSKDNTVIMAEDTVKDDDIIDIKNVDGSHSILSYKELAEQLSTRLKYEFNSYRMKEHLIYNYTNIKELSLNGVYINETVDTVRKADQYYRDSQRVLGQNSFNRNITAIKYRNKSNLEVIKGTFYTKEKKKPVNLEWEPIEYNTETKDIQDFIDIKNLEFLNISKFYYYNNDYDFKAKGKATLKEFLKWNTVDNSGIQTLKPNKVLITKEFIEKGVTTEKTLEVDPLKASFEYIIQVSQNEDKDLVINISIDLTNALKVYYAVYEQYDIINASYEMNIIKYPNTENIITATESNIIQDTQEEINNDYGWFTDSNGNYKYKDKNGKILRNTTTPDGYRVDRNGIWIQD